MSMNLLIYQRENKIIFLLMSYNLIGSPLVPSKLETDLNGVPKLVAIVVGPNATYGTIKIKVGTTTTGTPFTINKFYDYGTTKEKSFVNNDYYIDKNNGLIKKGKADLYWIKFE